MSFIYIKITALLIMDSHNLGDLKDHFLTKRDTVRDLLEIRDYSADDACIQTMEVTKGLWLF